MVFLRHSFLDSVTSRNLNHDLRVKFFYFLDHVTCMRGLTMILEFKKKLSPMYGTNRRSCLMNEKKCHQCKERIDRHV